jgi:hypothetical protein
VTKVDQKKRLGRVVINIEYVVDLDNPEMIEDAKQCIFEDITNSIKYGEVDQWIDVVPAPDAKEEDIPEFLTSFWHEDEEA